MFGNGKDLFDQVAYYKQPHSLYVFLLLQYGILGVFPVVAMVKRLWQLGLQWRATNLMKQEPLLATLWITLLALFLVTGLVETIFLTLVNRLYFVIIMSFLLFIHRATLLDITEDEIRNDK